MNILFYRYGSICEPDIIDAFKQLGNTVDEITIEIYNKNFTPSDGVSLLSTVLPNCLKASMISGSQMLP